MKNLKYIIIVPLCIFSTLLFIFSIKKLHDTKINIKTNTIEEWTQEYKHDLNILFLNKEQTKLFLEEDKDGYVRRLSSIDLYARKANNTNHYISTIMSCASTFTDAEKRKLIRCAKLADKFLSSYTYNGLIKGNEIATIPWKIAITRKNGVNQYEEGLPHTRSDVIFLSEYAINDNIATGKDGGQDDMILTNTLIHEKVHIYQRYNQDIVEKTIQQMGYRMAGSESNTVLKRSNPDINDMNYYDADGKLFIFEYKSLKPENINDVKNVNNDNYSSEHPYEKMAYDIANEYTKKTINNITKKII